MRPYKVEEKDKHRNEIIGRGKGRETLFCLIPGFELLIKTFNQVVGDIIFKAFHPNMLCILKKRLDRHFISGIAVRNNGRRLAVLSCLMKYRNSLRGITVWRKMKADYKPGFTVHNKPDIVLYTGNLYNSLVSVPFIRFKVKQWHELYPHIIKHRSKVSAPVADCGMRNRDIKSGFENQADVTKRVFSKIEHGQSCNDKLDRMAHSLEVLLSEKFGHGRQLNGCGFPDKKRVITLFVTATVIAVILKVVVQEALLPADRTGRMLTPTICAL